MSITQALLAKIEQSLANTKIGDQLNQKGQIIEIKDGVATVSGLHDARFSEIVLFENGSKGLVLDLTKDFVGILVLGSQSGLQQGDVVSATGTVFSIPVGADYIGRVVNWLAEPIDGHGEIVSTQHAPVERVAPGVMTRKSVDQSLETGIKAIDAMVPIGRGQRELIIWDRQTGKTAVAIDAILNQKGLWVTCIYVAIGQKEWKVRRIVETLKDAGAMDYTVVVSSSASDVAVMQYLAPYIGCTIGEWFMDQGQDALIIYDDLSKHAVVSLLLRRPPGREAYPGDVFYLHSRLLERAARVNEEYVTSKTNGKVTGKTGSLTALPIIETQASDVSAYIPTNVISITDGQIFLETDLFNAGIKPAINVWLSVSRVWGSAQTGIMKKVAGTLKLMLANYRELAAFSQFASDLDDATKQVLERGKRLVELLKQPVNSPIPFYKQVVAIYAGTKGYLDTLPVESVPMFELELYNKLDTVFADLVTMIKRDKKLTEEIETKIKEVIDLTIVEVTSMI
jgi:F-type H+-transporting ATPase subunit alpha